MEVSVLKRWTCFEGTQMLCRHSSYATQTPMDFAVFVPAAGKSSRLPVLTFLSGLSCTWENFTTKSGAQRYAAEHGIILVMPDTSPRGELVPNDQSYDLGQGAGFYVDALEDPWQRNFQMWTYITQELPVVISQTVICDFTRQGIFGHSMGGHGALIAALRNPALYRSVSAISPIASPSRCPWGQKAFKAYLGSDPARWQIYDASILAETTSWDRSILVDQGEDDEFLHTQLMPEAFIQACAQKGLDLTFMAHPHYDHSYYFISSVVGKHIGHHAKMLAS